MIIVELLDVIELFVMRMEMMKLKGGMTGHVFNVVLTGDKIKFKWILGKVEIGGKVF